MVVQPFSDAYCPTLADSWPAPRGHNAEMSESVEEPAVEIDEPPNLRPGPTEQGGHGGMATREQEERLYEEQHPDAPPPQ